MTSSSRFALIAGMLVLAGCTHVANPVLPAVAPQVERVKPDACNTKDKEAINAAGGHFIIPACGGTTSTITYGANNAPTGSSATVSASTTNPNKVLCGAPRGETVVDYFTAQLKSTASQITFGTTSKKSHIANPAFKTASTYTIFAYAFGVEQFSQSLGHPSSRGVLTFNSPVNGRSIPQGILVCFELGTP